MFKIEQIDEIKEEDESREEEKEEKKEEKPKFKRKIVLEDSLTMTKVSPTMTGFIASLERPLDKGNF